MKHSILVLLQAFTLVFAAGIAVSLKPAAAASVTTVGSGAPGTCTGIALAAAMNAGSGTINFNCDTADLPLHINQNGGYNVLQGQSFIIDGTNHGNTIVLTGDNLNRLFNVASLGSLTLANIILEKGNSGASGGGCISATGATLVLDHATLQYCHTNGVAGGAIYSLGGPVTLKNNSVVQNSYGYDYGAINNTGDVTILNSTIAHNAPGTGGGGVSVSGRLNIQGSTFLSNGGTGDGGAIWTSGDYSQISRSTFVDNYAPAGNGGAIWNRGDLTIDSSTFTTNHANQASGGAIYNKNQLHIYYSTFRGNSALSGGALANSAVLLLNNVTLADNLGSAAAGEGGGLETSAGTVILGNVTLSGNSAYDGGGISVIGGQVNLVNVTLSGNWATSRGGALVAWSGTTMLNFVTMNGNSAPTGSSIYAYVTQIATSVTVKNSVVSRSTLGANCSSQLPLLISTLGHNLYSDWSCPQISTDQTNPDPHLGSLGQNGGPTPTHYPLWPDSPLIDAIPLGQSDCATNVIDQRGAWRGARGKCTIGAVEYGAKLPVLWLPFLAGSE